MNFSKLGLSYYQLRKSVFSNQIKHWLTQVEHALILVVVFLGTALPALLYLALLAFGIVLDNQSSPVQTLIIIWCLLLIQSLIILLCKPAILGTQYQLYLHSLPLNRTKKLAIDILFALYCSPFLIMLLVIIAFIAPTNWHHIPHGFLLLALQIACLITSLQASMRIYVFLSLSLFALPLLSEHNLVIALALQLTLLTLVNIVLMNRNDRFPKLRISLPIAAQFWLAVIQGGKANQLNNTRSNDKPNALMICLAVVSVIILMMQYTVLNLPQYQTTVYFIACQLLVFTTASLQLSISQVMKQHVLFFTAFIRSKTLYWGQYAVSVGLSLLVLFIIGSLFAGSQVLVHIVSVAICIIAAKRYSTFFVFAWLCSCAISALTLWGIIL